MKKKSPVSTWRKCDSENRAGNSDKKSGSTMYHRNGRSNVQNGWRNSLANVSRQSYCRLEHLLQASTMRSEKMTLHST